MENITAKTQKNEMNKKNHFVRFLKDNKVYYKFIKNAKQQRHFNFSCFHYTNLSKYIDDFLRGRGSLLNIIMDAFIWPTDECHMWNKLNGEYNRLYRELYETKNS